MNLFNIGRRINQESEQKRESDELKQAANNFKLATDGGFIRVVKYLLFILFAYYNARLFIVTVPGWEGYMTAFFALAGEATALYCLENFNRSSGAHQVALGAFGSLLTIFSLTHATISWFRMESGTRISSGVRFYCEYVAFPLLFSLLLLAAIVIPLAHWRRKVANAQAKAQVKIQSDMANVAAESANLRAESTLERERLAHFEERIQLGNEYVEKLRSFAKMKQSEAAALNSIADPELRRQVATSLGITLPDEPTSAASQQTSPPVVRWRGGRQVDERGN